MIRPCPSETCKNNDDPSSCVRKYGVFVRKSDRKTVQRFHCSVCGTHFSSATFSPAFAQKKRHLNPTVEKLLSIHVTQRSISRFLGIHLTTVSRKLTFLGIQAEKWNKKYVLSLPTHELQSIQFDDLISFEHSKLKQLSIPLIVTKSSRKILAVKACQIPTSGTNAELARKKYGFRPNEHPQTLRSMFESLRGLIPENASFNSDSHKDYIPIVSKVFPYARHNHYKSELATIAGQGEMKAVVFDPLFSVNHTCAMLRANISRLTRRTWATTKKIGSLNWHLQIYAKYHNLELT
jgi:transposase-like protein